MIYYSKRISLQRTATSSRETPTPETKFLFGFGKADRVNARPLELTGIGARRSVHPLPVGARYDRGGVDRSSLLGRGQGSPWGREVAGGEAPEVVVHWQNGYEFLMSNCGDGERAPSHSAMALTPVCLWKSLERERENEEGEYEEIAKVKGLLH